MLMGYKRRPASVARGKLSVSDFSELPTPFVHFILQEIVPHLQVLVYRGYSIQDLDLEYRVGDSQIAVTYTLLDPNPSDEIELLYDVEFIDVEH